MAKIKSVSAIEILDSRGRPTLLVTCNLTDGAIGHVSIPSGASTGVAEALELRDNDPSRFKGYGCLQAVSNINHEINTALAGTEFDSQAELDSFLINMDGTTNKSRLGANAILGVSLAFCRAQAIIQRLELYQHFANLADQTPSLPRPMINLFSGGKHAGQQTAIQDVQLVMLTSTTIQNTLEVMTDVYAAAAKRVADRYNLRLLTADEGGLAPPVKSSKELFDEAIGAIEDAGYIPGEDVALTVDIAASHFYEDGQYLIDGLQLNSLEMVDLIADWCKIYPIISVEDGLGDTDWAGWQRLYQQLSRQTMILGDDLLCTNPKRIKRAVDENVANSLLLKVNQIGTVTEALEAYQLAKTAGWQVVVSARSGETEDNWLADLATGWAGDYIKVGSITQSERLAKYNRLLFIEHYTNITMRHSKIK
jgi:enolase 1/2/3